MKRHLTPEVLAERHAAVDHARACLGTLFGMDMVAAPGTSRYGELVSLWDPDMLADLRFALLTSAREALELLAQSTDADVPATRPAGAGTPTPPARRERAKAA